mgnify:CR=1 FL=1
MKGKMLPVVKSPIFSKAFKEKGIENVVKWDVFPVSSGEILRLTFESSSGEAKQGVWLKSDKGIRLNSEVYKSVELWIDTAPKEVTFECITDDGLLSLYNIWDSGRGKESQAWSSGMLIEELPKGRRYKCNDLGFETSFQKLVFRIERI